MDSYPFRSANQYEFNFTVSEGYIYLVDFSESSHLLPDDLKHLNLHDISFNRRLLTGVNKKDVLSKTVNQKIRTTICNIISYFMELNHSSLVFICDSTDSLANVRFNRFQEWEKEFNKRYETIWRIVEDTDSGMAFHVGAITYSKSHYSILSKEMTTPFVLSLDKE